MLLNKITATKFFAACIASLTVASGAAQADSRPTTPGYTGDSSGNIVMSGTGECVHTSSWSKDKATIAGCDGYTADTAIFIVKGEALDAITTVIFPQAEMFAFDKDQMTPAGEEYIKTHRDELGDDLAQAYSITVIGFTDSTGDADYNQGLSKRRAESVQNYLVTIGVPADKMNAIGRGEENPIASNDTPEGQAQNRRVEVVVIGQPRALDTMIFPSVALFDRKSAAITESGSAVMQKSIEIGKDQLKRATFIAIIGHTDDVGADDVNMELSQKRAVSVGEYLVKAGIDTNKIIMTGAGESAPIASNATDVGRAENRRVEVLVYGRSN